MYPAEVKSVLYQHPEVLLASGVGVTRRRWEETAKAFVILSSESTMTAGQLRGLRRDRLAAYKAPTDLEFLEDLPRNSTGIISEEKLLPPLSAED